MLQIFIQSIENISSNGTSQYFQRKFEEIETEIQPACQLDKPF